MIFATLASLFVLPLVAGHYTFPGLIVNGQGSADWQYVRTTANHWSNGPVTDVRSSAIRCYEIDSNAAGQTGIATVQAGSTVGFRTNSGISHPGYFSAYMSVASPSANSTNAGLGNTWFKIWEKSPTVNGRQLTFESGMQDFTFTIPKNVPSGQYLLRGEHVALHSASSVGGAQFYIGCAQLNVVNGGNGSPGPLVSFPGAYTGNEPGFVLNIYYLPADYTGYTPPGPAVWRG